MRGTEKLRAGKILREQQIPDLEFLVQRSGKPGADQVFELLPAQEILNVRPAPLLADTCMKNLDRPAVNLCR